MAEPLVSVKMITYNHAPFIAQAIDGVVHQRTDFPFELVIGEDCSTDGTRDIVFDYQKRYPEIIRVITSDRNVGMKKNGLRTLNACRGKYVAFCEGDDYWHHPLKLQRQTEYLERHPECGLVYSSYDVHAVASGRRVLDFIRHRNWQMPENPRLEDFVNGRSDVGYGILTCTVIVRRSVCMQVMEADPYLYQSERFLMGDTQLWAEIAARSHLHYVPESMATHVITSESATRSADVRKQLRFERSQAELMLYLCDKYDVPAGIRAVHEDSWCVATLRLAFHTRNPEMADEARKQKKRFTIKEWLFYAGAKSPLVHYPFRAAALCRKAVRRDHRQWA